jgi:hypothetical protein
MVDRRDPRRAEGRAGRKQQRDGDAHERATVADRRK